MSNSGPQFLNPDGSFTRHRPIDPLGSKRRRSTPTIPQLRPSKSLSPESAKILAEALKAMIQ